MVCGLSRPSFPAWMTAASRFDIDAAKIPSSSSPFDSSSPYLPSDTKLGLGERAMSAAGAAVLSAILVNPLDVAKTRLQAQAAGVLYNLPEHHLVRQMAVIGPNTIFSDFRCSPSCSGGGIFGTVPFCPPDCFQYKGTMDVFYKVIRQEGFSILWRGTNAALALAVPTVGIYLPCYDIFRNRIEKLTSSNAPALTPYAPLVAGSLAQALACITCSPIELARTCMQAFKEVRVGIKPPGVWQTLHGVLSPAMSSNNHQGMGAQLARDVPFSAICWSTLEPIRRNLLSLVGDKGNAVSVLGANFTAGFVAGSIAAATTCPLDVAKTRRQIEKDPAKAIKMTTRQTLTAIWRKITVGKEIQGRNTVDGDGGMKGLFMGVGPRVGRAGPSVGIVTSFYEVVKYVLMSKKDSGS